MPFQCQKQHYFPESWPLMFDYYFSFHFILNPDQYPVPERNLNVMRSGFSKAKGYGSCDSGSGSTTLPKIW
jgi:hypothetical protein